MRIQSAVLCLIVGAIVPNAFAEEWTVAENNPIVQVYVGKTSPDGTELVFELETMHFYSNQRLYGCIFVCGQIAYIKEYNSEDSYVRAAVKLPDGDEELIAYSGVIKAAEKIDPHDHAALWKAFVNSPHKPFRAKLSSLARWYVSNPIKDKRAATTRPAGIGPCPGCYPYLKPEERLAKAKEALDPATGDQARYYAVWGLAISGYTRQGAEALAVIAADCTRGEALRECAAMGLINFTHEMPAEVRKPLQENLREALDAEKEHLQGGVIQLLAAWGDADRVLKVLGDKLKGHPMEVIVLKKISSRETAVARLWEVCQTAAPAKKGNIALSRAWHAGEALIHWRDKRGIDILLECLAAKPAEDADLASSRQSRHNTFVLVAGVLGRTFGYELRGEWSPRLDDAVPEMIEWWKANRQTWDFQKR